MKLTRWSDFFQEREDQNECVRPEECSQNLCLLLKSSHEKIIQYHLHCFTPEMSKIPNVHWQNLKWRYNWHVLIYSVSILSCDYPYRCCEPQKYCCYDSRYFSRDSTYHRTDNTYSRIGNTYSKIDNTYGKTHTTYNGSDRTDALSSMQDKWIW